MAKDAAAALAREVAPSEKDLPAQPEWHNDYTALISRAAERSQGFQDLATFMKVGAPKEGEVRTGITLVSIPADGTPHRFDDIDSSGELRKTLEKGQAPDVNWLFLVENVDPQTVALLGGAFNLDPQCPADHIENSFWYAVNDIEDHLPPLPSVDAKQSFLRFRFIPARTVIPKPGLRGEAGTLPQDKGVFIVYPELGKGRPRRSAAIIQQTTRGNGERLVDPVMFAHASLSVWAQQNSGEATGTWTSIVFLDSPFIPVGINLDVKPPEHRIFQGRPQPGVRYTAASADEQRWKWHANPSHRRALVDCLRRREGESLLNPLALRYPIAVLQDLFRITASEWVVLNTYLKRELMAIDWNLENMHDLAIEDLEAYLRALFVYRRRIMAYRNLTREQRDVLAAYGRAAWLPDPEAEDDGAVPKQIRNVKKDLVADLDYVIQFLDVNSERVEKNITLIASLQTLSESKEARMRNKAVALLTALGAVFLPFSTIATIMDINGDYGPGQDRFWVFWVVSICVTAAVAVLYMLYSGPLAGLFFNKPRKLFLEHHITKLEEDFLLEDKGMTMP